MTTAQLPGPVPGHAWAPDPSWPVLAPYWAHAAEGALAFPRCTSCDRFVWYPQPMCPSCNELRFDWIPVGRTGRVYTYTVLHRSFLPGFAEERPLPLLLVAIDDAPGVRLLTSTLDGGRAGLRIEAPVEIEIRTVAPGVHLPYAQLLST